MDRRRLIGWVTFAVALAVLACALWIMAARLGLVPEYDFGAGAYYYADIPGYERIVRDDAYRTGVPFWVHVVLFLVWGWLMYRLWKWVDRH